ncbi:MAG: UV DNA damage repair endonuclease UvsE [Chloroflexi bacterium]|nr:UV DNA damage repair endonuclease UvsE [Chloroflexota bacterium]
MRIGYPCINLSLTCRPSRTFRLASYSEERLCETLANNLACLEEIIYWNAVHDLLFLRITSDLVPFGSHPANQYPWDQEFAPDFARIGEQIQGYGLRISMHPGQYTLLNSPRSKVLAASLADLRYHARVLDLLGLDQTAKIQIHVGGLYGDKKAAMARFVQRVNNLEQTVRDRLVVENDERFYTLEDALSIHAQCGIPVLLDTFHHELNPDGRSLREALAAAAATWSQKDGLPMVDYSSPLPKGRTGSHAYSLNKAHFKRFLKESRPFDFDLMLEVKNKERSALLAAKIAASDPRFVSTSSLIRLALMESREKETPPNEE